MDFPPIDREAAVREVALVYELIKSHLLLHHHLGQHEPLGTAMEAQSLLRKALHALNIALSVMKQQQQEKSNSIAPAQQFLNVEHQLPPFSRASAAADSIKGSMSHDSNGKRRRSSIITEGTNSSWVNVTTVPCDDGFEWRKYGEKKINGAQFTRSYFRCTYKEDKGCLATKYVQQKDNSDPPLFHVTYNNEHTCNRTSTSPAKENDNNPPTSGAGDGPPIGRRAFPINQQAIPLGNQIPCPQPILPVDVSPLPMDDQMLCPDTIPIGDQDSITAGDDASKHADILLATGSGAGESSGISHASCDNSDMEWISELLMREDDYELLKYFKYR